MSWRTQLKSASLDSVPFKVDTAALKFGRNVTISETGTSRWSNNDGTSEDKGKSSWVTKDAPIPREFAITAHFSGDNYIDERDAFIAVCERGGAKILILPTYDPIEVFSKIGVVRFSNKGGGWEDVDVSFVQGKKTIQPTETTNTEGTATVAVDDSKTNFIESFGTKLSSGAEWVSDDASEMTELVSTTINDTLGLGAVGDGLEAVTAASESLAQNATDLIYTPTALAGQINDTLTALTLAFSQPINAFNAQLQMFDDYGIGLPNLGSAANPTEQDAIDNQNSFKQIVQNIAIAEAGRAAVLAEYDSLDEAQRTLSRYEAAARAQQLANGDTEGYDESYYEIANILALVSQHIVSQSDLPSSVDLTFPGANTALSLAQDLYGDSTRADEIVTRNEARHPLFLQTELEALSF